MQLRQNLSGEKGIRTPGTLAGTPDFESEPDEQFSRETEKTRPTVDPRSHEKSPLGDPMGQSRGNESSPRAVAMAALYAQAAALASSGDVAAARTLHAMIGKMLGLPEPASAPVISLVSRRARGGRKE